MIQLKEYQKETLAQVRVYLETLAELRAKDVKARAIDPELAIDWPAKAWEKMGDRSAVFSAPQWAAGTVTVVLSENSNGRWEDSPRDEND
jgi:hypothetical protein